MPPGRHGGAVAQPCNNVSTKHAVLHLAQISPVSMAQPDHHFDIANELLHSVVVTITVLGGRQRACTRRSVAVCPPLR